MSIINYKSGRGPGAATGARRRAGLQTALLLVVAVSITACEGSSQKDKQDQGAILLELLGACTIGGVSFGRAGVGVACTPGGASGTGTLTATGPSGDMASIALTFTLGSGGSLQFLGGSNLSAHAGAIERGIGFLIDANSTSILSVTGQGVGSAAMAGGVNVSRTFCLEMHLAETYGHLIGKGLPCPNGTEPATSQPLEKDGSVDFGGGAHGNHRGWGFKLNNSTIQAISVNTSRRFTE